MAAVHREALAVDQRQRHARAVVAGREDFLALQARHVGLGRRREVRGRRLAVGRIVEHVLGRAQPAAHADQRAGHGDVGGRRFGVAFERRRHRVALLAVERHLAHARDGAVAFARVDAIPGERDAGQHGAAFGNDHRGMRQVGVRHRRGQQLEARRVLLRDHEQRLAVQRDLRRAVGDVGHLLPRRAAVDDLGQRRDVDRGRRLVHVVVGDRHGVRRVRRQQDVGAFAFGHVQARLHAAAEDDGVAVAAGTGVDVVQVGARVELRVRHRRVRAGGVVAHVEERLVVGAPADRGVGGAVDRLGVHLAGGHVHHVQHALLRAAGRDAVRQQLAVVGRFVEPECVVRGRALAELGGVEQQVLLAGQAVAVVELGQLRRGLGHLVEVAVAAPHEATAPQVGVHQLVDTLLQGGVSRDRVELRARRVGLRLHPGLDLGVGEVLHVAVVVDERRAEVVGRDRPDRGDGLGLRGGDGSGGEAERERRADAQRAEESWVGHGLWLLEEKVPRV